MANARQIEITMADGSVWHVDALKIAETRADYYACKVDGEVRGGKEWLAEVAHGLADDDDAIDYMQNNMDWSDLGAVMVTPPPVVDYEATWSGSEFRMVTVTP